LSIPRLVRASPECIRYFTRTSDPFFHGGAAFDQWRADHRDVLGSARDGSGDNIWWANVPFTRRASALSWTRWALHYH